MNKRKKEFVKIEKGKKERKKRKIERDLTRGGRHGLQSWFWKKNHLQNFHYQRIRFTIENKIEVMLKTT